MKSAMIGAYAKMIKDGLCTIDDLPEEYRGPVTTYREGDTTQITSVPSITTVNKEPYGALYLGKQELAVDVSDQISIAVSTESVFEGHLISGQPEPSGLRYSPGLVENTFRKYEVNPEVTISNTGAGFILGVNGHIINAEPGSKLLRVDINVESSNYEDMVQTIYLIAK